MFGRWCPWLLAGSAWFEGRCANAMGSVEQALKNRGKCIIEIVAFQSKSIRIRLEVFGVGRTDMLGQKGCS